MRFIFHKKHLEDSADEQEELDKVKIRLTRVERRVALLTNQVNVIRRRPKSPPSP